MVEWQENKWVVEFVSGDDALSHYEYNKTFVGNNYKEVELLVQEYFLKEKIEDVSYIIYDIETWFNMCKV